MLDKLCDLLVQAAEIIREQYALLAQLSAAGERPKILDEIRDYVGGE